MQISLSKLVEEFGPKFGISKEQIEDTYSKPDKTSILGETYVTVKFYGRYAVLITYFIEGERMRVMNAYKVFPDMLSKDPANMSAVEILQDFMERFGMDIDVPGVGTVKTHLDEANKRLHQGILNIEKYMSFAGDRLTQ